MTDEGQARATSDQMLELLRRLQAVEREKRGHPLGSPEFVELAREAERLSRLVFRWSGIQQQIAEASPGAVASGTMEPRPLDSVDPRPLDQILTAWRDAQLRFDLARPGSPEAQAAGDDIERLREEYRAVAETKDAGDLPERG